MLPHKPQGIIATLEKRGLLKRSPDPDDGRRLKAQLTADGRSAMKAADTALLEIEGIVMGSVSSREIEHAIETLLRA